MCDWVAFSVWNAQRLTYRYDMQDYVHVNKYHVQGDINKISSKMTALDD